AEDYINKTERFARLNISDRSYLAWRFTTGPFAYRFFELESRGSVFLCALRYGSLGRFPVLVCSEAFFEGCKPARAAAVRWLRLTARRFFASGSYAGIYFHAPKPEGLSAARLLLQGVVRHRELPICVKYPDPASTKPDWFTHFQLSDCDIG